MSTNAPKPPSKKLLLATGVAAGFTIAGWLAVLLGILVFQTIPPWRQVVYIALGLASFATTGYLGTRYVVQKRRRDSWWEGFVASDEPMAEVIHLSDVRGFEDSDRVFRIASPGG